MMKSLMKVVLVVVVVVVVVVVIVLVVVAVVVVRLLVGAPHCSHWENMTMWGCEKSLMLVVVVVLLWGMKRKRVMMMMMLYTHHNNLHIVYVRGSITNDGVESQELHDNNNDSLSPSQLRHRIESK